MNFLYFCLSKEENKPIYLPKRLNLIYIYHDIPTEKSFIDNNSLFLSHKKPKLT